MLGEAFRDVAFGRTLHGEGRRPLLRLGGPRRSSWTRASGVTPILKYLAVRQQRITVVQFDSRKVEAVRTFVLLIPYTFGTCFAFFLRRTTRNEY